MVGKGYTLRAMTGNDNLDKQIEKAWKRWCKARNCDVTGEQSFNEILRMMVERKKVDGGMIVLYRHTRGGVVPFKLQCLEVDELDKTQAAPRHQGNRVVGGIEYNQYRRPVGYWIRQYDIEGWQLAEPAFIEAKDVFFYKSKHRPSQLREMSDMSPTITRVRDTNADKIALQSGQKTFQDLQAEKGKDWKDAVDELAEVLEYGRKKGIDMGGVIFGTGTTAAQQSGPGGGKEPDDPEHGGDPGQGGEQPGGSGEQPAADS